MFKEENSRNQKSNKGYPSSKGGLRLPGARGLGKNLSAAVLLEELHWFNGFFQNLRVDFGFFLPPHLQQIAQ
jgi:hypothetical protein